jgi:hypothetical protein
VYDQGFEFDGGFHGHCARERETVRCGDVRGWEELDTEGFVEFFSSFPLYLSVF